MQSQTEDVPVVWDDVTKQGGHARASEWLMLATERKRYAQSVINERNDRLKLLDKYLKEPKKLEEALEKALKASKPKPPSQHVASELTATWKAVSRWFANDASPGDRDDAQKAICRLRQTANQSFR